MNTTTLPTPSPRHFGKLQIHFYANKNTTIIKQTIGELVFVSMELVKFKTHKNVFVTVSLYWWQKVPNLQKMKYKSLIDLRSSGIQRLVNGWWVPDISGQRVGLIFKSQMSSEWLFSPWWWDHQAVPKCRALATKRNIAEDRRPEPQRKGSLITHKSQECLKIGCWREWVHDKSDLRTEKTAECGISWLPYIIYDAVPHIITCTAVEVGWEARPRLFCGSLILRTSLEELKIY